MSGETLFGAWLFVIAIFAIYQLVRTRQRTVAIRAIAERLNLTFIGGVLPSSLSLKGTELEGASAFSNVIDGDRRGMRIIAFDYQIGERKARWRGTAIAVKSREYPFTPADIDDRDLTEVHVGLWSIRYRPKPGPVFASRLMPVSELEAHIGAL